MRFATDTGGTFTDLLIEDDSGFVSMFKAATVPDEPVKGVLAAFDLAAREFRMARRDLLARGTAFIHGTTHAINAIVTKRTAKTALLVSKGHPDILVLREGGRLEPFNHAVPYPQPYIPRALTFEVPERILASGVIHKPLDEAEVARIAERLRALQVEAVAVCLLWSVIRPDHEIKVGEILSRLLPGVPVTLSHAVNPSLREYRRAVSTAIDASLKPLMNQYTAGLSEELRKAGFAARILFLTSQGGMVDVEEARQAPILIINSGPSMAPIAGVRIGAVDAPKQDAIIFDTGGTTFDVSLVRDGRIPFTHETWFGRPFQSDLTGFPSVDVKSIGAGGGSIAWVDAGGVLHVGPQSSGAVPGPACYGTGGKLATVTDAALALGYIDPRYFLGGRIPLDRDAAMKAVTRDVAGPLGMPIERAALAIMSVWTENMVQAITDITVNQGIDPSQATIIGGGGAAGLNAVAIAARLGCRNLLIPEVGAALSAFGAAVSDISREYRRVFVTGTKHFDRDGAAATIHDLERAAAKFVASAGVGDEDVAIEFTVEARYAHQVWEIDVPIEPSILFAHDGIEGFERSFHKTHEQIFAFADPASPIEVIAWRAAVRCRASHLGALTLVHSAEAHVGTRDREAHFQKIGWVRVPVYSFDQLKADATLVGPAIVESPFTSVVIDPGVAFRRTDAGNLVLTAAVTAQQARSERELPQS
jgi:N-methylhydantoinase A